MTIWFTSDTHFGHGNVIWYCDRPYADAELALAKAELDAAQKNGHPTSAIKKHYFSLLNKAVEKMDDDMIAKWNSRVAPGDTVYHLGDFAFSDADRIGRLLDRLNGQKFLIYGNHDKTIRSNASLREKFIKCCDYYELSVPDASLEHGKQGITLCHYAMLVWNKSHHGNWMLHGHSHGSLKYPTESKIMDVGVDPNGFAPISYEEVKQKMAKLKTHSVDHH